MIVKFFDLLTLARIPLDRSLLKMALLHISCKSTCFCDLQQTLQNKEELQKLRRESHVLRQELQQCKETIQKLQQREKVLKERYKP